ncbi:glycosyltransferase [Thalassotalea crassostreae]|uniref:glycosyltransferase n=1 Tax=Thalassotalea crassostreae TaxID=1763536 RepID=UPI0012FE0554|nr:glycosyltransferase family 2 protein [Thalassotalea crassostreae]
MNLVRIVLFMLLLPLLIKYITQLVALCFYPRINNKHNIDEQNLPSVSILVPAYNEEVGITKTLRSVVNTHYNKLQIIVINDGSTDNTDDIISEFQRQHQQSDSLIEFIYLSITNAGKANALNHALKSATGDIIMTIDGDCLIDKDAVINTVKHFHQENVAAVAGNVVIGNKRRSIEIMQQLEYLFGFFLRRADSVFNAVFIIGGAAAAYRHSVLKKLGGFNHDIVTEDIEMSLRILNAGYRTRYAADAITYTEGPSDWRGLFNQRLRWKFGRFQTLLKFKNMFFSVDTKHSVYLTWLVLPLAIYGEVILMLEAVIISLFYGYSVYYNDYLPILTMIGFISVLLCLQVFLDSKPKYHRNLIMLAPVAWLIFYIVDIVELQALYRSLKRLLRKQSLTWQKWIRVGL